MDNQIEDLLPFYALNVLSDEERDLVETYLKDNPDARRQVEEIGRAAETLPFTISPVGPSPETRAELLARIAADGRGPQTREQMQTRSSSIKKVGFLPAFSLGIAAVAIIWALFLHGELVQLRSEVSALRSAVNAQALSLGQINNSVREIHAQLPQPRASEVVTIALSGTELEPDVRGQLIADPTSSSALLVIDGLSPLDAALTYQVWLIDAGGPVSAGFLTVDQDGQGVLVINSSEAIGLFDALGVSIEPAGGSPLPEGRIVVLNEL